MFQPQRAGGKAKEVVTKQALSEKKKRKAKVIHDQVVVHADPSERATSEDYDDTYTIMICRFRFN